MSRFAILGLSALFLSITAGYLAHSQTEPAADTADTSRVPLTLRKRVLYTPSTQHKPIVREETYSRRRDGSYARRYQVASPAGEKGWAIEMVDRRNGVEVSADPFLKLKMTFYGTAEETREWLQAKPGCTSQELQAALAPGAISDSAHGKQVIRVQNSFGSGETREAWIAPSLGCYPLQMTMTSSKGAQQDHSVIELQEGEPPDSAFDIPAEYLEASPLQMEAAWQAKYPGQVYFGSEKVAQRIEERYQKNHASHQR